MSPRQGISRAGGQQGLQDPRSCLVREIFRLWDEGVANDMPLNLDPNSWIDMIYFFNMMIDSVDRSLSTLNKLLIKPLKGASSSLKMSGRFCLQNFGQLWIFWWRQNPTFSPITCHWELAQAAEHRGLRLTWATVNGHNVGAPAWNSAMFFTNWFLGHAWMVRYT